MRRAAPYLQSVILGTTLGAAACELDTVDPLVMEPMTLVGADRQSHIYSVDEVSGNLTLLDTILIRHPDPMFWEVNVPIGVISSMAWVPTADMWWLASGRRGSACPNCLFAYEPEADRARAIRRNIGDVDSIADFAVHPTNGRLYTFPVNGSGYLFRVEPSDGVYTEVSRSLEEGSSGKGTTFWTDGHLYVAGGLYQQRLTRIDVMRAMSELVGPFTYVGFPPFREYSVTVPSMATRASDGVVFAIVQDGGGWAGHISATYLATVDPTNAVVRHVGETSPPLNALAYVPTRLLP
jgi:hypothetical protein